jgi:Zn-dependent protease with chaperone function
MSPASWTTPFPYQRDIVAYLREQEPGLWEWFSSSRFLEEHAANVRLDLLKTTYRLERAQHPDLYSLIDEAQAAVGIEVPVTLYQTQSGEGMNASLAYVPDQAHVVLTGPVVATLSRDELRAVFAHELGHHVLWQVRDGELLIAEQVLSAMAAHPGAEPSHAASARLFRLYLELSADRGSLSASAPLVSIAALVKVSTGLSEVSAESYLVQADEIAASGRSLRAEGQSHPESFIRARALKVWADRGDAANAEIAQMLEGQLILDELDLLGQRALQAVTRHAIGKLLAPHWMRTEPVLAHARHFFEDFDPAIETTSPAVALTHESVRDYLSYVLLDFAAADESLDQAPLAAALLVSRELGVEERFHAIAAKELKLKKKAIEKLVAEAPTIVEGAARQVSA